MKKFLPYVLVGLAVYMARDQIAKLPLVSKLPTLQGRVVARAAGIVVVTGAITAANELLFAPAATGHSSFNWRLIPATAGLALALTGLEKLAPGFAVGLAWLTLATALVVPFGSAPTPLENAAKALGYAQKVT